MSRRRAKPEPPQEEKELLCRLRCGDHHDIVGDPQPEWVLRLVVREWPAIRAFERDRAKNVIRFAPEGKTLAAAYVGWPIPDWGELREFMRTHAGDKLELLMDDGSVKPVVTSFGQMLPQGYGREAGA